MEKKQLSLEILDHRALGRFLLGRNRTPQCNDCLTSFFLFWERDELAIASLFSRLEQQGLFLFFLSMPFTIKVPPHVEDIALAVVPGDDEDKVGHEGGDVALEDGVVAQDHVGLLVHMSFELLGHDCSRKREKHPLITIPVKNDVSALAVHPAGHRDKVGDKAGDVTLEDDVIAVDDVLLVHVGIIAL